MFNQRQEHWKETDKSGSCEYGRRITHEEIPKCNYSRRYASQCSSQRWRKSTDKCAGFNDHLTFNPSDLWFQNDLEKDKRQRCCHHSNDSCNQCRRNQQKYCENRSGTLPHRRKCCNTTNYTAQVVGNSANPRTVRVIPTIFIPSSTTRDPHDFQARNPGYFATDPGYSREHNDIHHYGPFRGRMIKITPTTLAERTTRRYRSLHERYSSEREYLLKVPNAVAEVDKYLVGDTAPKKWIATDDQRDTVSKRICSEFTEIPLIVPECNQPKVDKSVKISAKNLNLKENNYEMGKCGRNEREKKSIELALPLENSEMRTNREIPGKNAESQRNLSVKRITTHWLEKTLKNCNKKDENQIDAYHCFNDKHMKQTDLIGSQAMSTNVESVCSDASKLLTEIRQAREKLRKVTNDSGLIVNDRNRMESTAIPGNTSPFFLSFFFSSFHF